MKAARITRVLALAGVLAGTDARAAPEEDFQVWGNVTAIGAVAAAPAWRYWLEGQGRFNDDGARFGQGILRPGLGYALSERMVAWAGYGWIASDGGAGEDLVEHRLWQQLTWRPAGPVLGLDFASRTRLEQRYLDEHAGLGWRLRQFVRASRALGPGSRWSAIAYDELFVNLNDTRWGVAGGLDQNRAFAGVGMQFAREARFEIGYLNQYVVRDGAADRMNHILSLGLFLNF